MVDASERNSSLIGKGHAGDLNGIDYVSFLQVVVCTFAVIKYFLY